MNQEAESHLLPPSAPAVHGDNREEAGGANRRKSWLDGQDKQVQLPNLPLAVDPPVPDHVDGPDARGPGDLDDSLAHAAVGGVLDDRVTWG